MTPLTQCPVVAFGATPTDPWATVRCVRPVEIAHNTHEGWQADGTLYRWATGEALIAQTREVYDAARQAYVNAVRAHLAASVRERCPGSQYLGVNVTLIQGDRSNSVKTTEVRGAFAAARACECGCVPCSGACRCGGQKASNVGLIVRGSADVDVDDGWISVLAEFDDPAVDDRLTYAYDLDTGSWSRSIHLIEESDDDDDDQ